MFKHLIALSAGAIFSLDASAGYISYNLGGDLSGTIIQNDVTNAIVDFNLNLYVAGAPTPYPFRLSFASNHRGEGTDAVRSRSTYFPEQGPTNFSLSSNFGGDQFTDFTVDFSSVPGGAFSYAGRYDTSIYFSGGFQHFSGALGGGAQRGTVDPALARYLAEEHAGDGATVPYLAPANAVPEPASLALLAAGMLAAAGTARRRNSGT